jgi:hypothetical protein
MLGEILDGALTIYRRHFGLFLRLGVVALFVPVLLEVYIAFSGGAPAHQVLFLINRLVVEYFAGLFLMAAAIRVISESYLGREPHVGETLSLAVSKTLPLFGVGLAKALIYILIGAGISVVFALAAGLMRREGALAVLLMLVGLVGGGWFLLWVACGYAVTTQAVVLEPLPGAFESFGRSWDLTRGHRGRVFVVAFVAGLIVYLPIFGVALFAASLATDASGGAQVVQTLAAVLSMVLKPILGCVFTLMYYDLRVRREAFDLQILGQQLGLS